ncbi:coiled-coil-helix-coiled-coil-helix domain-containing protein 1-like [Anneissia japonica]|uniref:coiled-coil-helix-coiled-coil-helix domain-containing protein 1-like n=1 Tax=Anneissia japonica TaxID=1529436 RepID=UPI0014256337|nr:coiled-coil-helix-coiled-coil-helix domain-containing protein 1-like [Anneissia japonica]XP_033124542.1 coiled-coil-helix-coiled-coil-helix domain-containing protein 1-like [Anneissia japonica]
MSKRVNEILLRNVYKPLGTHIPLQRPFALRNNVALRKNKRGAAPCVTEMSVLMSCWKQNSYNDSSCLEEITAFQKCFVEAEKEKKEFQAAAKEGKIEEGRATCQQVNTLMKKFPQQSNSRKYKKTQNQRLFTSFPKKQ